MRFFLTSMLLSLVMTAYADNYKIESLKTSTIVIGGKTCRVGDVFSDKSAIVWGSNTAFVARNMRTKKKHRFCSSDFRRSNAKSIEDYYLKTNRLSTREYSDYDLAQELSRTHYLVDTLRIRIGDPVRRNFRYEAAYANKGGTYVVKMPQESDFLVFTRSLFEEPDRAHAAQTLLLTIYRTPEDDQKRETLTDQMIIEMVEW